jgi:hypothetical protein
VREVARAALAALALFALLPAPAARAEIIVPPPRQLTVDVDVASLGVTYASRLGYGETRVGGGAGFGLSPILGRTFATGSHFDPTPNVSLLEVVSAQLFLRFALLRVASVDTGVRAGAFIHGNEDFAGGPFFEVFVAPSVGWRWIWIGPRVSGGVLSEKGGPTAAALTIDYVTLRLLWSW